MKNLYYYVIITLSIIIFLLGYSTEHFNIIFLSIIIVFCVNIIYSLSCIRDRIVFLFFNVSFFTFLLSKYFIEFLSGVNWWSDFSTEIMLHTMFSLFLSLIAMHIGTVSFSFLKKKKKKATRSNIQKLKYIKLISKTMFFITYIFALTVLLEQVIFVQQTSYIELYIGFVSKIPLVFAKIGSMYLTFLFIFLSTIPSKKEARIVIFLQLFYLIISIFGGVRGPLVIGLIILIIFIIYHDSHVSSNIEKWFQRKDWVILFSLLPIFLAFLSIYNSIRNDIPVQEFNLFKETLNFFTTQGGSVNVISYAKKYESIFPVTNTNYTFGGITRFFNRGTISSLFTGLSAYTSKLDIALYDNNFVATITYLVAPQRYFEGGGLGGSYIAEIYYDFGYIGLFIYNFIIGAIFSFILSPYSKWWILTIGFLICNAAMAMPRDFALSWVGVFLSLTTWIPIILTYFISDILVSKYDNSK